MKVMETLFATQDLNFNGMIDYEDIQIPMRKVTFLTGESGSGKSTLLKMCNGIITPRSGRIFYRGQDVAHMDTIALRKNVSLVSQEVYLFDGDIRANFETFYHYRRLFCPTEDKIKEILEVCGLYFPLDKDTATMSGGERQRLYLAVFLSFLPETVLLDEPTSALDTATGRMVMSNIIAYCRERKISAVIVSHSKELVQEFSENTVELKRWVKG